MVVEPNTRKRQKELRRDQIIDAALSVFSAKGYSAASIRDIAKTVGVTEGLLYHYFESKEQLLYECWKERSWRPQLERILSEAEGKPIDVVLTELLTDFLKTLRENAPMVRMCATEMQSNPVMSEAHCKRIQENQNLIISFLKSRQELGEIRSGFAPHIPATLLLGSAYSAFLLFGTLGDTDWNDLATDLVKSGVDVVMNGIHQNCIV